MTDDDTVGYGRPPKHTRFKTGQSGNPKGRPKGANNLATEMADEMREVIPVRERGQSRRISKRRAIIKSLTAKAIQGDARAAVALFALEMKLRGQDDIARPAQSVADDQAIIKQYFEQLTASKRSNGENK